MTALDQLPPARLGDRSLFPTLAPRVYANHAAISAPSLAVQRALRTMLDDYAARGMGAFGTWLETRIDLRTRLAAFIGAPAASIAFVQSTTWGVHAIATCFPWRTGDRVVLFEGEFPANVTPWQCAARDRQLEIAMLPLPAVDASEDAWLENVFTPELRRGVRLVAVSAVQFQTGLRMPIDRMAQLAHAHGAELFVDAVQAVGVLPFDVTALGVDYAAVGSHKWMMAMEGAGMLYVAPGRVGALRPNVAGWLSHEEPVKFLLEGEGHLRYDRPIRSRADFVEIGNLSAMSFEALRAAVTTLAQLGPEAMYAHVQTWIDAIEGPLVDRGFRSVRARESSRRSGILSLRVPHGRSVVALHRALMADGVSCSMPDGYLRFSPHWPNSTDEIDVVLRAVDRALAIT